MDCKVFCCKSAPFSDNHLGYRPQQHGKVFCIKSPRYGTADEEIKDPSVENSELKGSPFNVWSRSAYSHACFTYCRGFFPWTNFYPPGPFTCIFSPNLSWVFPVLAVANTGSCVGPQNKFTLHVAPEYWCMFPCLGLRNINRLQNMCSCFSGLAFRNFEYGFDFPREIGVFCNIWGGLYLFLCEIFKRELLF